jgi:hypothetical protein
MPDKNLTPVGFVAATLQIDGDNILYLNRGSIKLDPGLRQKKFYNNNGAIGIAAEFDAQPSTLKISAMLARDSTAATSVFNLLQANGTGGIAKSFNLILDARIGHNDSVFSRYTAANAIVTAISLSGKEADAAEFEVTFSVPGEIQQFLAT